MPHKDSKPDWLSVTEVLSLSIPKPFLMYWYGKHGTNHCERVKRESQEIGKAFHQEIEERFINPNWTPSNVGNIERMVDNFWNDFVIPHEVKALKLEQTFEDKKLKLQGTLDAIIETNEGRYIADWKTSNQLDKIGVPLQLAAYAHLSKEGIWKGLAVRVDKEKNKVQIEKYENLDKYWPIFLKCLDIAKYIKFGIEEKSE